MDTERMNINILDTITDARLVTYVRDIIHNETIYRLCVYDDSISDPRYEIRIINYKSRGICNKFVKNFYRRDLTANAKWDDIMQL